MRSPNLNGYVAAIARQVQLLEDAVAEVMTQDLLAFATGVNLDSIGALVGLPRMGLSDGDYRDAIEFQVFVNHHTTSPDNLAELCRRLAGADAVEYMPQGAAVYSLRVDGGTIGADLRARLQRLTAAGVRLMDVHRNPYTGRRMGDRFHGRFFDEGA